jgi:hypothetical protein
MNTNFGLVSSFGGARLLMSRLARTPAPPKKQIDPPPNFGLTDVCYAGAFDKNPTNEMADYFGNSGAFR